MTKDNLERRAFGMCVLEIRVEGEVESPVIVGHAAVFDQTSADLGGFVERIAPGAFSKTLGGDVLALFNHDPSQILGRTTAKTLRLREDLRGLAVEIDPPDSNAGRDVVIAMKRGDLTQMSFGFRTIQDSWEHFHDDPSKLSIRTLIEVELRDVSPVTFPAYPQTDVALRSLDQWNTDHKPPTPATPNLDAVRQLQAEII